ncbi:MAG: alpha/beta hydrolase [Oscillatoriales cyanobacterium]|nr:MAG: alpha/beta hydrolase [Oscillatoriales cyanobacterium]
MSERAGRFPDFLTEAVADLTEAESIDFVQQIQRQTINVPLPYAHSLLPIATSFVRAQPAIETATDRNSAPILAIHGFDSSLLEYRRLLPKLAEQCATWAIDLLGFGFTDRPEKLDFTAEAIRTHLYAFWQQMIGQPVILIGASMGGSVAMDFALTYPEAVQKLVLLDSAGFVGKPIASRFLIPPLGQLATQFLSTKGVRSGIGRKAYADPDRCATEEAYRCGALHLGMPRWSEALISFTRNGGYTISGDRIAQIPQETLILWGDRDQILGTQNATRLQATIPKNQLVWIDHCGHVPHLEQPDHTADAIWQFIDRTEAQS